MINAIHINFPKSKRIGCWFHLKQDLMRECKTLGLLNPKNKKVDVDTTLEVITHLSLLPLEYNGDIKYLENKINILAQQYNDYRNLIKSYFSETQIKYFKVGSYNNNFPKDIRSNSILERYNRIIKSKLGAKRSCYWIVFLNFIDMEILRVSDILSKNENINILYERKTTKFGKGKYIGKTEKIENNIDSINTVDITKMENISSR